MVSQATLGCPCLPTDGKGRGEGHSQVLFRGHAVQHCQPGQHVMETQPQGGRRRRAELHRAALLG
ncbi:hypothetical protein ACFFX0_30160 [Citricoccus parietis]|uniref:Uncharacterized protein n=1 Tax=Citricoccus parietis TaxID=592307 RepID=A0ABV5G8B7_9MICC